MGLGDPRAQALSRLLTWLISKGGAVAKTVPPALGYGAAGTAARYFATPVEGTWTEDPSVTIRTPDIEPENYFPGWRKTPGSKLEHLKKSLRTGGLAGLAAGGAYHHFRKPINKYMFEGKAKSFPQRASRVAAYGGIPTGIGLSAWPGIEDYTLGGQALREAYLLPQKLRGLLLEGKTLLGEAKETGREFLMGNKKIDPDTGLPTQEGLGPILKRTVAEPARELAEAGKSLAGTSETKSPFTYMLPGTALGSMGGLVTSLIASSRAKKLKDESRKGWIASNPTAMALLGGMAGGMGGLGYYKLRDLWNPKAKA